MELTAIHEDSGPSREETYCYAFLTKNLLNVSIEGEDVSHNFRGLAAEFCFTFYVYSVCIHPALWSSVMAGMAHQKLLEGM